MNIKGVSKNIQVLGLVSFLNDVSSEMIFPVVPIFLSSVLGVPTVILGLIEGISDATSNILMAVSGLISDKVHKRKVFVEAGYSFSALSHLMMAMASSWPMVLLSRVTSRTGKGIRTAARDAIITESSNKSSRGKSFGFHRAMDSLGGVIGPLLAIFILKVLNNDYRMLFLIAFIPTMLGVLLIRFFIKESKTEKIITPVLPFMWKKTNSSFKTFLLISFVFALGNSSEVFMILRSQSLGISVSLTVLIYVIYKVVATAFSLPAGVLADKIGSQRVLFMGFVLFAIIYSLFGYSSSQWMIWILMPIYGVFIALTDGVAKTYLSQLVPHEIAASAFGIYQTLLGVATLLSSTFAGYLWSQVGPESPFYFGAVMALIAATMFFFLTKKDDLSRVNATTA